MTREQIKKRMLESITAAYEEEYIKAIENHIDEDDIEEFMWAVDFGKDLMEAHFKENRDSLIMDYLQEIYDELDTDDLTAPF